YSEGLSVFKTIKIGNLKNYSDFMKEYSMFAWNRDKRVLPIVLDELLLTIKDERLNQEELRPIVGLSIHPKSRCYEYSEMQDILEIYSNGALDLKEMRVKLADARKKERPVEKFVGNNFGHQQTKESVRPPVTPPQPRHNIKG